MDPALAQPISALLTSPLTAVLALTAAALLVAAWIPRRLRRLGFQPGRKEHELDWAGLIGLCAAVIGMLLGLGAIAAAAELARLSGLLGAMLRVLLSMLPALAILAGAAHHTASRRSASMSRKEEEAARGEARWIQRGAMLVAALTLVEMSLSLPALVLIAAALGLWMYRNPALRKRAEEGWAELKAGQQLRSRKLTAGDAVGDLLLAGPVGLLDSRVQGQESPVPNSVLLEGAPAVPV